MDNRVIKAVRQFQQRRQERDNPDVEAIIRQLNELPVEGWRVERTSLWDPEKSLLRTAPIYVAQVGEHEIRIRGSLAAHPANDWKPRWMQVEGKAVPEFEALRDRFASLLKPVWDRHAAGLPGKPKAFSDGGLASLG